MPVVTPAGQPGQTRAQQIAYYSQVLSALPGVYQGNYAQYDGLTWQELYQAIAESNPSADPRKLADAVLGFEAAQSLGKGTQAAGAGLGKFISTTDTALANTNFLPWVPNVEQWIIRGFEMLLGLGLIIVAVAKLASTTSAGRAAAKAGKAAMIL